MVQSADVEAAIRKAIPDAVVTVEDLTGGGDHLQVSVVSSAFDGLAKTWPLLIHFYNTFFYPNTNEN